MAGLDRHRIEVPEWGSGGKPLVVTWSEMTLGESDRIYRRDTNGRAASGGKIMARALWVKACDENGKPLFTEMNEMDLMQLHSGVVGRIANAILYGVGNEDAGSIDDKVERAKNA